MARPRKDRTSEPEYPSHHDARREPSDRPHPNPVSPSDKRAQDEVRLNPPDGGATQDAQEQSLQQQGVGNTDPAARTTRNLDKRPALVSEPEKQGPVSITWLGEGPGSPETNTWNGITFRVGESVPNITSPYMIEKARNNRFYKVG